ncbi:hypothetical protein [Bradyrhizobium centrosematis]|uniref:hypothetical protein n=1 Tax=Bradyrhizobium centrosematis TaxID=1300039 RepID=UPI0021689CAB|nr:hypothetical protein [Bradyrhizobium centrosematis]MCS3764955.1 hypothetical protein [Bradyrhizobium centrosematis]MCS3777769.1 hypothetical protein [Bradyrhizobium centrosematis]
MRTQFNFLHSAISAKLQMVDAPAGPTSFARFASFGSASQGNEHAAKRELKFFCKQHAPSQTGMPARPELPRTMQARSSICTERVIEVQLERFYIALRRVARVLPVKCTPACPLVASPSKQFSWPAYRPSPVL